MSSDTSWVVSSKKAVGSTLIFVKSSLFNTDSLTQTKADILGRLDFLSDGPQIMMHGGQSYGGQ